MSNRPIRERLQSGETVIGIFQSIRSIMITELLGHAGFDFVIFDQEHGPLTAQTCLNLCAAAQNAGLQPIVRVRDNDPPEIQRALDLGADVEIPQIESVEDAESAVSASRFEPLGRRGLSPYVRAGAYDGGDGYTDGQNDTRAVIVHVEGQAALNELDGILHVEGIDVVFIGPYDLSQSMGIPGEVEGDRVEREMARVCEMAEDSNTAVGVYADHPDMANKWIDSGAQFVALSVDVREILHKFSDLRSEVGVENKAGRPEIRET